MAAKQIVKSLRPPRPKQVLFSSDLHTAQSRSRMLYRTISRALPMWIAHFDVADLSVKEARGVLKKRFANNRHITDPRVLDMLIIKAYQTVEEADNGWCNQSHFDLYLRLSSAVPSQKFMDAFLDGR